ncbi:MULTISPECIES: hypothetical protein [Tenacibaculum]|uniref:hypothetical protein n=1 Tax=Tenacibaculum TaxID=104267 RepID=UPI001F0B5DF7|nr:MULTISPECIES: hypothetical protein [Tenacibaculum]MCH3881385.1 hypothetical protein [Tenacibaculum aquimarinum]MDO6599021.1 hypothetical protein [Tenacibaculum sp. 1_MG-2023]
MKKHLKYYINEKVILNTIFVLCFFIYLKKLPIDVETQPFILFFLGLVLVFFNKIKLTFLDQFLVLHLVILTVYFTIQFILYQTGLIAFFTYLVGPIIYFSFKNKIHLLSLKKVKYISLLFIVLAFVIFFKIPWFYDFIKWFYSLFISRPGWIDGDAIRGFSLLAPEPSYFAFPAVLLLVLFDLFQHKSKSVKWYKIALLIVIIFSKSALVFLYVFIYIFFFYLGNKPFEMLKKISQQKIIIFTSIFLVLIIALFFIDSRVSQVFNNITNYFYREDGFKKLLFAEESGSTRFIINYFGFTSIEFAPFGWGIGEFQHNFKVIANQFPDIISKHWTFKTAYLYNTPMKAQTYFANLVGDIGVFSISGFIFVFLSIFQNTGNNIKRGLQWLIFVMLILVQGQISNPIPWILLAIINSNNLIRDKELIGKK